MRWGDVTDPLIVIDGDLDAGDDEVAGVPAVFVGTAGAHGPVDVIVADDDELAEVDTSVREHPEAAVALAVLLRGAAARSRVEGLVAESSTYALLQAGADHRAWLAARPAPSRPATTHPPVRVERDGNVVCITLDRPEVRNAYDAATRDALVEALAIAAADADLTVELRGSGPSFCSGGDLTEFGTTTDPAVAHRIRLERSAGRAIAEVADRVTVHVHGACVGAGVELPAFAGRVVARADATFWLPEVAMGLIPGAGGTVSITGRIGRQRTALLALTGRRIDARTALAWGLVDSVDAT